MKIFSGWLRNLFSKEVDRVVEYSKHEKSIWYKTKDILGFRLVKKYISDYYKSYGISIISHIEEDGSVVDNHTHIIVYINRSIYTIRTPFTFIKPIYDYTSTYTKKREDGIVEKINYDVVSERKFSITTYHEDDKLFSVFLYWNYADQLICNLKKHKGYFHIFNIFFWNHEKFISRELIHPISLTPVKDITNSSTEEIMDYINTYNNLYRTYIVKDYDNETIDAKAFLVKQNYKYGINPFTCYIMSLFKKPTSYIRYEIMYNTEIGRGKETWKGGTLNMSGLIDEGKDINDIPNIISKNFNIPIDNIKLIY